MDFFETVKRRRSIRSFTNKNVSQEDIAKILEVATLAPSATNDQPWHFIVIRDKAIRNTMRDIINAIIEAALASTADKARVKRLSKMRIYSIHFANAPVAIAILARPWIGSGYPSPNESTPRDLGIQSASMASAQLLLAATALGYGSCYSSAPAEFARVELEAILGVKSPWFLLGIISLGIPSKIPEKPSQRKSLDEVTTFI